MRLRTLQFIFAVLIVVAPCRATTFVHLSLTQLSRASTAIVSGRATKQECRWNADHSMIMTLTTITVDQVEKGLRLKTLVVEQPGGVLGNLQMRTDGTARFYPLASYVLFLESSHSGPGHFMPVGMMQGVFRIYRDAGTGIEHVIPPVQGEWGEAPGSHLTRVEMTPSLSQFESRVRGILASPIEIPQGLALRVALAPGWNQGQGNLAVEARTVGVAFPNPDLVIPAGSSLAGEACRLKHGWRIRWTSLDIRGEKAKFAAVSHLASGKPLKEAVLSVIAE